MDILPKNAAQSIGRFGAAAQNALEIARFGGLQSDVQEASPYEVVADVGIGNLRRYFPDRADADRPAVLLVPPLMLTAEVWDVSPETSAAAALDDAGIDPWVVDFGSPEQAEGGLERTLTDHVITIDRMVDVIRDTTGRDVHIAGYSQGGMFCYQTAAHPLQCVYMQGTPSDPERFQPPADACNTYRALFAGLRDLEEDVHRHVHLENAVLFPAAQAMAAPNHE